MLKIGCHLSSAKGFLAMGKDAVSIGANTFQFFTRNPRGSKAKEIDPADAAALRELAQREGISNILAHALYAQRLLRRPKGAGICPFCDAG